MPSIVITGLPGTGKTYLSMNLGAALLQAGQPALILHTDILKVTMRTLRPGVLSGPGYNDDFRAKVQLVRPILAAQVAKADKEGYTLIVEGTLALGFYAEAGLQVLLELSESERQRRISQKHESAKQTLMTTSLETYRQALKQSVSSATLRLDATQSVDALVASILAEFKTE
jgi:shikimate kinase